MPKCRVVKGGWFWRGVLQEIGDLIEEGAEWIANRVRDGLCEPIADEPTIETATAQPKAERAVAPRQRKSK